MARYNIHLIACGVLRLDMDEVLARLGIEYRTTYLEGGLHEDPARLRRTVQAAIDEIAPGECERIVLGYGLCGRGTVGITARDIPLVVPRVHDCIALFLGADAEYRREFAKCPGTYYISAGWYEEKVQPRGAARHVPDPRDRAAERHNRKLLAEKYGEENADEIVGFLSSWQRNYRRAAYIDTGAGSSDRYESYAEAMADAFGWEYERLEGDRSLLERAVRGDTSEGDILIVNPGFVTDFEARERKLVARPVGVPESRVSESPNKDETPVDATNDQSEGGAHSIGIGIDAGGTYTDAVVFDFGTRAVLDKGKALTTKWDYAEGIEAALDQLDVRWFERVDLVSVSTTLATNAIVEGTGQKTGLILMPHGSIDLSQFHQPCAIVAGRIDIAGNEVEPLDAEGVAAAADDMVKTHGVQAFAVSGYGGSVNPIHEIAAKRIIEAETGRDVCCGHELSAMLDFRIRANTAVLNAGIIPLLERFLADVQRVLDGRSIKAVVMVVKGDGTLMQSDYAQRHPVETILSGPAASIAGAKYLTDVRDATVVDVGGTTSDIGKLREGMVRICGEGAEVGKWRTHVQAIDMRTVGLGGDSEACIVQQELSVGPRRIAPISWLADRWDSAEKEKELAWLEDRIDDFAADSRFAEVLWATGRAPTFELTQHERSVLDALAKRPLSRLHLVEASGCGHIQLLHTERLEAEHIVQRCGLTPTDALHVTGHLDLWDLQIARRYAALISNITGSSDEALSVKIMDLVTEKLIFELVRRQLDRGNGSDDFEHSPTAKGIVDVLLTGGNRNLNVSLELTDPVIGLGAAAPLFLTRAAKHLHARLEIPDYAEVANAVGAITSMVSVARTGSVVPSPDGTYRLSGVPGAGRFDSFDDAYRELVVALETTVVEDAEKAGTNNRTVAVDVHDRMSTTADGTEVFLERQVIATVTGAPRTAPV